MDANMQELVRQQSRAYVCPKVGHNFHFILPLQTKDESREVLCVCVGCEEKHWKVFPEDGYKRLLADNAAGKIK